MATTPDSTNANSSVITENPITQHFVEPLTQNDAGGGGRDSAGLEFFNEDI